MPALARTLAARLPFYYGWVVLAGLCLAGFARQGPALAPLSVFVLPMTREFGWSRAAISGAVSLGGVLAALAAPIIGPLLDRRGPRLVLCVAVLVNGTALFLLSFTPSLLVFYVLFCIARMNWAAPFDLAIYGAINNWFVERRAFASSVATLAQMAGLVVLPLVAQFAIDHGGWRNGWAAIGFLTLAIGFLPSWLLLARRPEDLGFVPDGAVRSAHTDTTIRQPEQQFSRRDAIRTSAFWMLLAYTILVYPVQAGVSLHQAPHLIERGISPTVAAAIVATFSAASGLGTLACSLLPRRLPLRFVLAFVGAVMATGPLLMTRIAGPFDGYVAGAVYGFGIGAMLTLLPVAWADYFGRSNFGAIRGVTLSAQVLAQATGPLLSGALHDWTGNYMLSLYTFAALASLSVVAALGARRPVIS
ncbi:MAG TPA: MFS transporter [Burkholderiales bacterium]|nr:MFS transporter [Burkholderiales bacterium]